MTDAGSFIGNIPFIGEAGDPISGTHNGKLTDDARARRRIKNARTANNKAQRAEENKSRKR